MTFLNTRKNEKVLITNTMLVNGGKSECLVGNNNKKIA